MISEIIYNYIESNFNYSDEFVNLPNDIKTEIKNNWENLLSIGKNYTNGELFTVDTIKYEKGILDFNVKKTNYAHYLYSIKNNFNGYYLCRSIASNILPITFDNYFVLATMSKNTSLANKIKFVGGALSEEDRSVNTLNPLKCITRETYEELGLNISDNRNVLNIKPKYFITRKNLSFINTLFIANLNITAKDLLRLFNNYQLNLNNLNEESELSSLVFIKNDREEIKNFMIKYKDRLIDYLKEVFLVLINEREANDITTKI